MASFHVCFKCYKLCELFLIAKYIAFWISYNIFVFFI